MSELGIAQASAAMCNAELRAGMLVALLTDYALEPVGVHAVLPGGPRPSAKVRAFTDFLAATFKAAPHASVRKRLPRTRRQAVLQGPVWF